MKKKVLIGVGGVLLVLIVFIWQVVANLDGIVAGVIEDVGSKALKTKVSVSGVSIDLKAGKAGIAGLTIDNPDGYSNAKLFDMEGIVVELDIASLSQDVLVIKSILIQNPKIVFEGNDSGGSNMQTLLDNMDSEPESEGSTPEDSTAESKELKLIIDRFDFSGADVTATSKLKSGDVIELELPAIKMSGIGRSEGGVTTAVAVEEVVHELVGAVIKSVVRSSAKKAVEKKTKGIMDKLGDKLKGDG